MTNTLYVGIDVSKEKLDTSITINSSKTILAYETVENKESGFKKLYKHLNEWRKREKLSLIHVCTEATGVYSDDVSDYLRAQKKTIVSVVNPAQIKYYANTLNIRTKNDKVDSKVIALYCCIQKPKETPPKPPELKELKALVRYEDYLNEQRAHLKTKIQTTRNASEKESIQRLIKQYSQEIKGVENQIYEHIQAFDDLKQKVQLLSSIIGIQVKTASRILVEMLYTEDNALDIRQQIAHAGLAPRQKMSGSSVRGKPQICKMGNSRLRKYLYMPTISARRSNPLIRDLFNRLIS